jgi:two-component system sensor histidine kinase CssS
MPRSLRTRLLIAISATTLAGVLAATALLFVLLGGANTTETLIQAAIAVAALLALVGIASMVISAYTVQPVSQLVRAMRELSDGRHPDEAFSELTLDEDLSVITDAFRAMAIKLREVDSSDRRFLMSVSHELRTPLTAIAGHAQALEDGLAEDPSARALSLAVIQREASRLERLVEDIVDLARLRTARFTTVTESVYLDDLGDHLTQIFADRTSHSDIDFRGDFEHILLHSDGQRILQIVRNLVNNALRYAKSEVVVTGERVRGRVRVTVMNDGDPIPEYMHEKIFEPFVGTKREGGMGLGLAIGRELAFALGGNLRCVPSETGAVFELTLPLEPPSFGR